MPKLRPLDDKCAVLLDEPAEVSKGGIIIPDQAKERPVRGKVLAVGPGRANKNCDGRLPMQVKTGDRVLIGRYAGAEVPEEYGKDIRVVHELDILAVLNDPPEEGGEEIE